MTKAVLPYFRVQGSGHIIQISSIGGRVGPIGRAPYAAAKFGVEGFSESLSKEVRPLGVRVTIIEPGGFRTDWSGRSMIKATPFPAYTETAAGQTRKRIENADKKQPGNPASAAKVIIQIAEMSDPPLRLPLGADALQAIRQKIASQLHDLEEWETLITSTSFEE